MAGENTTQTSTAPRWVHPVVLVLCAGIFVFDVLTPLGHGEWVLYLFPLLVTTWSRSPKSSLVVAAACTGLVVLGFCLLLPGAAAQSGILNRAISVVVLWVTAVLLMWRKQTEAALREVENRHRAVLEDQTEVISRFKADGTVTFVNEVFCRFFGKSCQELLGRKWHPQAVAEDLPMIEAKLRSLSPSNPVVVIENRVYSGSGEVRWIQFVNRAFFDADGRLVETQSVGRDITDRKQAEEKLQRSEEAFRLVTETINDVFWMSTLGIGRMVYISPAYEKTWGQSCESLYAEPRSFLNKVHPDDLKLLKKTVERFHARGLPYSVEYRITGDNGSLRWIHERGYPIHGEDGTVSLMTGICTDITERKRAEREVQRLASFPRFNPNPVMDVDAGVLSLIAIQQPLRC